MVDLHCHILPGLDDGPHNIELSLAMAESAIADGITHVVATPHSNSEYFFEYSRVRELREQLQTKIGDRLFLATGCDFHLNPENLDALHADAPRFCINQRDYLLVEFNEYSIPPAMDQTLHEIQLLGLRPVITHPERNAILRLQTDRLVKWVRLGCFIQVTAGSLTGVFGPGAQKDAGRPLKLKPAFDLVSEKFGEENALALFVDNPLAAFEGRELPHVPELRDGIDPPRRKRFFFF
jgi:protein-tyrosine phosphatase